MSRAEKAGSKACRLPPCPSYDVEGMESWLADMAERGLLLQKDGIFAGIAVFERGIPRRMKYRLEASGKGSGIWAENWGDPAPEAVELSGRFGWEYMAKRGDFYIYRFTGTGEEDLVCSRQEAGDVRELNTDPEIQALTIRAVKKRQEAALFRMFFWMVLYPFLQLRDGLLHTMIQIGTWFWIFRAVVVLWLLTDALVEVLFLGKLQKRLLAEGRLNHASDWRKSRLPYYGKKCIQSAMVLTWVCIGLGKWSASVLDEDKMPLSNFQGKPPFAAMKDLAGEGAYYRESMPGIRYNYYREWADWLAPVNIRWSEHATVTRADGSVISGGLYVDYHEMISPQLAGRMAVEYYRSDMRGSKASDLKVRLPAVDYAAVYWNRTGFPTAVIQDGRFLIHVTFYQISQNGGEIPLEEWIWTEAENMNLF